MNRPYFIDQFFAVYHDHARRALSTRLSSSIVYQHRTDFIYRVTSLVAIVLCGNENLALPQQVRDTCFNEEFLTVQNWLAIDEFILKMGEGWSSS